MPKTRLQSSIGIACYQTGSGPAMTLIHGVGMNASYWDNITAELKSHFSLTVIDLPGHGNSKQLDIHNPALADYTDVITNVINSNSIIVGHSMGALIALDFAVRYKQLTTGIAILNGIYRRDDAAVQSIQKRVSALATTQSSDPTATLARWFGDSPTGTDAVAADQCRQWLYEIDPVAYADAYRAFAYADAPADNQLSNIQCPALFMTGSREPNSTPDMSSAMSRLVPDADCRIVDGARHMMSLTHGKETSRGIIEFFKDA